jgi:hypothetical protein
MNPTYTAVHALRHVTVIVGPTLSQRVARHRDNTRLDAPNVTADAGGTSS